MSCEFEVEIKPGGVQGHYWVEVLNSPAGEASGQLRLDVRGLLRRRWELQAAVLASAVTTRQAVPVTERPIREVGEQLFTSLFIGPVYGRYTASVVAAAERGEPLQVVLRVRAPELAALPWEMLFDPEIGSYLCQTEPLLRYVSVPVPIRPQQVGAPLRVLGVIAAPNDLLRLDVSEEQHRMTAALADLSDDVELVWLSSGRWPDLQSCLLGGPWHVVHFVGHGGFRDGEGVLAMVGSTGAADYVSAERFTSLLSTAFPPPRLVVLNSCSSGEAGAENLFSSTAAALLRSGVPAVVAMQFAVSDPAAVAFTGGFYAAVAHNRSVGEAVRIGRIAIRGTGERTLEWVTPVLYLRGHDTPLFTLETRTGPVGPPTGETVEEAARAAALSGLYTEAQAEVRLGHYDEAAALLDNLLTLDSGHRDATELRDTIRRRQRAAAAFARGLSAERAKTWSVAIGEYKAALVDQPDHLDAIDHLAICEANEGANARRAWRRRRRLSVGGMLITMIAALATSLAIQEVGKSTRQRRPQAPTSTLSTLSAIVPNTSVTLPPSTSSTSTPPASRPSSSSIATTTTSVTSSTPPPAVVASAPPPTSTSLPPVSTTNPTPTTANSLAYTTDNSPCTQPQQRMYEHWMQICIVAPGVDGRVPVYPNPDNGNNQTPKGYLTNGKSHWFVGQIYRSKYTHGRLYNAWWAYTLSDDRDWGWVPEVYLEGGENDERDRGLYQCADSVSTQRAEEGPEQNICS